MAFLERIYFINVDEYIGFILIIEIDGCPKWQIGIRIIGSKFKSLLYLTRLKNEISITGRSSYQ